MLQFDKRLTEPTTDALDPIIVIATCGAGITAAAGTSLTHHLFAKEFTLGKSLHRSVSTEDTLITLSHSVKFSRLLHPVGLGTVSQFPSRGNLFQGPYRSQAWWAVTPPTT